MQVTGGGVTFGAGITLVPPPTVPKAPIIGTATPTSGTTAVVTYTGSIQLYQILDR